MFLSTLTKVYHSPNALARSAMSPVQSPSRIHESLAIYFLSLFGMANVYKNKSKDQIYPFTITQ